MDLAPETKKAMRASARTNEGTRLTVEEAKSTWKSRFWL